MSRQERTGWRDKKLSLRHKLWGFDCPMTDIDFLVVEYDRQQPIAPIEYKCKPHTTIRRDTNITVMARLGDMADLPAFIVCYGGERANWRNWTVMPCNSLAVAALGGAYTWNQPLHLKHESAYVDFLYGLRGRPTPAGILARLAETDMVARADRILRDIYATNIEKLETDKTIDPALVKKAILSAMQELERALTSLDESRKTQRTNNNKTDGAVVQPDLFTGFDDAA